MRLQHIDHGVVVVGDDGHSQRLGCELIVVGHQRYRLVVGCFLWYSHDLGWDPVSLDDQCIDQYGEMRRRSRVFQCSHH